jgi:hypothetical protein
LSLLLVYSLSQASRLLPQSPFAYPPSYPSPLPQVLPFNKESFFFTEKVKAIP